MQNSFYFNTSKENEIENEKKRLLEQETLKIHTIQNVIILQSLVVE